jgi:hypothetical protein
MNAAYTTGWRWACGTRGGGAVIRGLAALAILGAAACIDDAAPSEPDTGSSSDSLAGAPKPGIMPFSALALQNGWSNAPFGTRNAGAFFDPNSGITHFSGAVAGGTSAVIFTLPNLFWPSVETFIPVDLCGAANGRLIIQTNGVVSVQAEAAFSNAQCFTSLEGATYASTTAGFSGLTLQNGWTNDPPVTSIAVFGSLGGAIRFKGAISSGTNPVTFTLPAGFRPATNAYVPVDLCNATNGRLFIQPSGVATVQAENGTFSNAQCFTSLDGAWFLPNASGTTALTLQNGWTGAPFGTAAPAVKNIGGIVHFEGAIAGGISGFAFMLPAGLAPTSNVYVPVDLCNATKGRLFIQPSGVVSVQAENGTFSNAQCFTSLEGASYSIAGFVP